VQRQTDLQTLLSISIRSLTRTSYRDDNLFYLFKYSGGEKGIDFAKAKAPLSEIFAIKKAFPDKSEKALGNFFCMPLLKEVGKLNSF
jgi:hypothetical protein